MNEQIDDKIQQIVEYSGYLAVVIGFLQGTVPAEMIGHQGLTILHEAGILESRDPADNITALAQRLLDDVGHDVLMGALWSLIASDILVIDDETFAEHYMLPDTEGEIN